MRLTEVTTRDKVPTGAPGDNTNRLRTEDGAPASMGWALTLEAGVVTATKGDQVLLIPMSNVAFARYEPPAKASKPGPTKAA